MRGAISLKGMSFHAFHGVHAFEKAQGNTFSIDLTFIVDIEKPAKSDNLNDTLDYEAVYREVADIMQFPVNLLEHLAFKISSRLLARFSMAESVEITVSKKNPPLEGLCEESAVRLVLSR